MATITGTGLEDYPHIYPPPGFIPINRAGALPVPANTPLNAPLVIAAATIALPLQQKGYIRRLGITITSTAFQAWSILQDGAAIRDFTNINSSYASPSTPDEVFIELRPGQTITLTASNTDPANAHNISWLLSGWYYFPF